MTMQRWLGCRFGVSAVSGQRAEDAAAADTAAWAGVTPFDTSDSLALLVPNGNADFLSNRIISGSLSLKGSFAASGDLDCPGG